MVTALNLYRLIVVNPSNGQRREARVVASTERHATLMALRAPMEVLEVSRADRFEEFLSRFLFRKRASIKHLAAFYSDVAGSLSIDDQLLGALTNAIPLLRSQTLRYSSALLLEWLKQGQPFSEGFKEFFRDTIPDDHIEMIEAADASGQLKEVFAMLGEQIESRDRSLSKAKKAMIYPSILMVMALVAACVGSFLFIPKLEEMYKGFHQELPRSTQIMMNCTGIVAKFPALSILPLLIPGLIYYYTGPIWSSRIVQGTIEKIPLARRVIFKAIMSKCLINYTMMIDSGVTQAEALETTSKVANHHRYYRFFQGVKSEILAGNSLFAAANTHRDKLDIEEAHSLLPRIKLGQENGDMDAILRKLAKRYQDENDNVIANLEQILSPVITIVMGGVICVIILALFMPLANLSTLIPAGRH